VPNPNFLPELLPLQLEKALPIFSMRLPSKTTPSPETRYPEPKHLKAAAIIHDLQCAA
jgi:hypothetical protein